MKGKFILAAAFFAALAFFGCKDFEDYWTPHDFIISNNSSRQVTFSINNYGDGRYELGAGQFIILQLYDNPGFDLKYHPRVCYSSGAASAYFYDMESYVFEISNSCLHELVLSEKDNLLTDVYGGTETIPAASLDGASKVVPGKTNVKVYGTKTPSFSAYYIDQDNNKVDATSFISFVQK